MSQPKQVRAAREASRQHQNEQDMRTLMAMPEGRRLLWRLIDETACVFSGSFTGDALSTALNEGKRSVGIALMQRAQQWAPDDYIRALAEAVQERRTADLEDARAAREAGPEVSDFD